MNLQLKKFNPEKISDDRVCVFIGKRNTGKSTLVKDISIVPPLIAVILRSSLLIFMVVIVYFYNHFFANFSIAVPKNIAMVMYSTASTSSLLGEMSFGLKLLMTIVENSTMAPRVPMTRFDDTSSPAPNSFINQSFIATKLCQKEKPLEGLDF